jgi:triacylglycerol lipase
MRTTILAIFSTMFLVGCGQATEPPSEEEPAEEQEAQDDLPESKAEAADLTNQGKADWTLDICEARGWYGDGECDWYCPRRDEDCNADPLGPDPAGVSTQYPIVLAHGFMGSPTNFWAFNGVEEALEADGHVVYSGEVPPFHSPAVRAETLAAQVDRVLDETGAEKVNIIAHSMGGVDSRYLISTLGYGDRVASLTTISSPHRGTKIADIALAITPGAVDGAIDALLEALGQQFSNEGDEASFRESLEGIAVENMPGFNDANPDHPDVYYQSWAGLSAVTGFANGDADEHCDDKMMLHEGTYDHMSGLLWALVPFVAGATVEPNDGMATVESSKWGEFQGCIPADHLDEVGQLDPEPDPDTGFDHIRFYRNVAYGLAERGF